VSRVSSSAGNETGGEVAGSSTQFDRQRITCSDDIERDRLVLIQYQWNFSKWNVAL
jgi:hypothetical protein